MGGGVIVQWCISKPPVVINACCYGLAMHNVFFEMSLFVRKHP